MRAVKGSLGHSSKERQRELEGLLSTRAAGDDPGGSMNSQLTGAVYFGARCRLSGPSFLTDWAWGVRLCSQNDLRVDRGLNKK